MTTTTTRRQAATAPKTKISWATAVWNPVTGCSRVSPGCANCYAEAISLRFKRTPFPWTANHAKDNVQLHAERLGIPLRWRTPQRIFVNSVSDLFHEVVPDEFIAAVFGVMARAREHTFLILTKRPERMRAFLLAAEPAYCLASLAVTLPRAFNRPLGSEEAFTAGRRWPLPNVALGVSAENQEWADQRIPILLKTPAAVRFLSCEPLLDPVDLSAWLPCTCGEAETMPNGCCECAHPQMGVEHSTPLDWVICGGESGPSFRPMDLDWARSIRDQCVAARVPFWYKQGAGRYPERERELDGQRWEQLPAGWRA